jgi:hypothetical protein
LALCRVGNVDRRFEADLNEAAGAAAVLRLRGRSEDSVATEKEISVTTLIQRIRGELVRAITL